VEDPSAGTDSLNFGAVTLPLEVRLGSVNVTGPGESVTYAGNSIEEVVGGTADDTFVMTAPTVVFNGWLDGGGGTNTLRYDDATPAITAAVAAGQKPNVWGAFSFASVVAVPPASMIAVSVPAGTTTTDAITRTGISQIVKQGAGTLVLDRTNSHSGGTLVEAGEVIVKSVSALGIGGLEVAAGAKATFDVGQNAIKLGFIKFDGLVNLGEATMTVASGLTSASLVAALVAGRGDGSWNGSRGITSAAAAAQTAAGVPRTVGWTDNGDGSFTIGYTAPGDTNLDNQFDVLDAANFIASGKFDTGQAATWAEGNFNYDLVVDILDVADFFNGSTFASLPLAATNAATFECAYKTPAAARATVHHLQADAAGLHEQRDHVLVGHAEAAGGLGHHQAEHAHVGELLPDRIAGAVIGVDDLLALFKTVLIGQESSDRFGHEPLFFAEFEIHDQRPRVALAIMLRWISLDPA
jgi:autotransporter-associated beta strand protein